MKKPMSRPDISVVLPVYNGERYVEHSIRSILGQDVDFELVVSDDLSTDRTLEIVRGFTDRRIRVLDNTENRGIFGNLNRTIQNTSAPLIQVFSQDDLMAPNFLRSQADVLLAHSQAGLVYDAPSYMDAESRNLGTKAHDDTPEVIAPETYFWISSHYGALPASISSIMFTRRAYDDVGCFDESYRVAGDLEFYNRLSEKYTLVRNLAGLHQVRGHSGAAQAHPTAGRNYLEEEIRLSDWYRARLAPNDYIKVMKFRAATRGRYHLGWIARSLGQGNVRKAVSGLLRMNRLYPLPWTLWALAAGKVEGPPRPHLAPPRPS